MPVDLPTPSKKVTWAPDSKIAQLDSTTPTPVPETPSQAAEEQVPKVDGVIGQLEVHQSGAVKMRLGNGIILDVRGTLITLNSR
jgi:DNA-directed RNA polymerase III subunit RPC4